MRETKSGEHHGSEVCVEPNDAKQQLTQIVFDLGVFVFEFWVLRFRDLGASFSSFGCFVFEIWVLRASVFVFECFVFETTLKLPLIKCVTSMSHL